MLSLREDDVKKFLVCGTHLGATNLDFQMEQYVYKRKADGKNYLTVGEYVTVLGTCVV